MCHLAFSGIVEATQVKLIFNESEVPQHFDNLGFMDSVTDLYVTGRQSHLTTSFISHSRNSLLQFICQPCLKNNNCNTLQRERVTLVARKAG